MKQQIKINQTLAFNFENFNKLEFFRLNRPINQSLVISHREKIRKHGQIHNMVLGVLGNKKNVYYVLDGQHRILAMKDLKMSHFNYTLVACKNERDMFDIMIDLNNKARNWTLTDFIKSFANSSGVEAKHYQKLLNGIKQFPTIQDSVICVVLGLIGRQTATKLIKEGKFEVKDLETSKTLLDCIVDCQQYLPPTRVFNEALANIMIQNKNYALHHRKMIKNLKAFVKRKETFGHKSETEIRAKLIKIYEM